MSFFRLALKVIIDGLLDGIVQEWEGIRETLIDTFTDTNDIGETEMTITISKTMDEVEVALAMSEATKKPVRIRPNQNNTFTLTAV